MVVVTTVFAISFLAVVVSIADINCTSAILETQRNLQLSKVKSADVSAETELWRKVQNSSLPLLRELVTKVGRGFLVPFWQGAKQVYHRAAYELNMTKLNERELHDYVRMSGERSIDAASKLPSHSMASEAFKSIASRDVYFEDYHTKKPLLCSTFIAGEDRDFHILLTNIHLTKDVCDWVIVIYGENVKKERMLLKDFLEKIQEDKKILQRKKGQKDEEQIDFSIYSQVTNLFRWLLSLDNSDQNKPSEDIIKEHMNFPNVIYADMWSGSRSKSGYVPKPLMYEKIIPHVKKYKRVWLLDADISFLGFDFKTYFGVLECAVGWDFTKQSDSLRTGPLISQPLISDSGQLNQRLNYNYWYEVDGTYKHLKKRFNTKNVEDNHPSQIASQCRYIEQQAPVFDADFFEWFFSHIIKPYLPVSLTLGTDHGFDWQWCVAAEDYSAIQMKKYDFFRMRNKAGKNINNDLSSFIYKWYLSFFDKWKVVVPSTQEIEKFVNLHSYTTRSSWSAAHYAPSLIALVNNQTLDTKQKEFNQKDSVEMLVNTPFEKRRSACAIIIKGTPINHFKSIELPKQLLELSQKIIDPNEKNTYINPKMEGGSSISFKHNHNTQDFCLFYISSKIMSLFMKKFHPAWKISNHEYTFSPDIPRSRIVLNDEQCLANYENNIALTNAVDDTGNMAEHFHALPYVTDFGRYDLLQREKYTADELELVGLYNFVANHNTHIGIDGESSTIKNVIKHKNVNARHENKLDVLQTKKKHWEKILGNSVIKPTK